MLAKFVYICYINFYYFRLKNAAIFVPDTIIHKSENFATLYVRVFLTLYSISPSKFAILQISLYSLQRSPFIAA